MRTFWIAALALLVGSAGSWWHHSNLNAVAQEDIFLTVVAKDVEFFLPVNDPALGLDRTVGDPCVFVDPVNRRPLALVVESETGEVIQAWPLEGVMADSEGIGVHCLIEAGTEVPLPAASFYRVWLNGVNIGNYSQENLPAGDEWALPLSMNLGFR